MLDLPEVVGHAPALVAKANRALSPGGMGAIWDFEAPGSLLVTGRA